MDNNKIVKGNEAEKQLAKAYMLYIVSKTKRKVNRQWLAVGIFHCGSADSSSSSSDVAIESANY